MIGSNAQPTRRKVGTNDEISVARAGITGGGSGSLGTVARGKRKPAPGMKLADRAGLDLLATSLEAVEDK